MAIAAPLKEKPVHRPETTMYSILFIIGICHLLNDSLQAVIPAMFPILERSMNLTFTQTRNYRLYAEYGVFRDAPRHRLVYG